jgi:hypothetical protein
MNEIFVCVFVLLARAIDFLSPQFFFLISLIEARRVKKFKDDDFKNSKTPTTKKNLFDVVFRE